MNSVIFYCTQKCHAEVEREKMKAERQIKQYAKTQDMASAKV